MTEPTGAGGTPRETAGVTTRLIVTYVERELGADAVERLRELAGDPRPVAVLSDERTWSSYRQKIALFAAAAELTGDPQVARAIGSSVLVQQLNRALAGVIGALGSPQQVLRSVAKANVKFSTSATMWHLASDATSGVVAYRLHDEHEPSRHDCLYTQGLLAQVPTLFGLPEAVVSHPHCQVDGADACIYELEWPRWRRLTSWLGRARRREHDLVRDQVSELERAVADLVGADDARLVLQRIAARAGVAVQAQRHLLVVELDDELLIHAEGIEPDRAAELGRILHATGRIERAGEHVLSAPVVSSRRRYGWLAAFTPAGSGFLPAEPGHLASYARLAAAALDVTAALAGERASRRRAAALLMLAGQLAAEVDEAAIATRVAAAAPVVVGCDRVLVLSYDQAAERLRVDAAHGYGERHRELLATELAAGSPAFDRLRRVPVTAVLEPDADDGALRRLLEPSGAVAIGAPLLSDEEGLLGVVVGTWASPLVAGAQEEAGVALTGLADQATLAVLRRRLLDRAVHAATHDHLTGLVTREVIVERIERSLADHRRTGVAAAVCFLDLDGFKPINDRHGHAAGDQALIELARRLRSRVRGTDQVGRLAGDEFVVLLDAVDGPAGAVRAADDLRAALTRPIELGDGRDAVVLDASIGVALLPEHGTTAAELLAAADAAMYRAKSAGGGTVVLAGG